MATFNEGVFGPEKFVLKGRVTLDPTTDLSVPKPPGPPLKTLTVANGSTILVYDVTNPGNPVLIQTIG